ncbi:DUF6134 family protein [Govanella unica]|uniref:DUF6134 family protein n=1 Tax=Govanella unica TaxID=2975056 RepID=A0A9X3Z800_9PROT|nr:DUF6134 family protein [Govania unica]MDA5194805.1 DUF6134 family protein [Govania unica]
MSLSFLFRTVIFLTLPGVAIAASLDGSAMSCSSRPQTAAGLRPDLLYGNQVSYDIRRNGDLIGHQETRFSTENGILRVVNEGRLKVKVLFVTAYSYSFDSVSLWCGETMTSFEAHVNDNGKKKQILASATSAGMRVNGPEGEVLVAAPLYPTEHWNPATLKTSRILNSQSGRIDAVQVTDLGEELIAINSGSLPARHYSFRGDLDLDVWYDRAGRWVKLRFVTKKDKSVIDYICDSCAVPETPVAGGRTAG